MTVPELNWGDSSWPYETGAFFRRMSISARREFELLATRIQCAPSKLLIAEDQKPFNVLFLLEGEANISMTSLNGRQFLLGVAGAGEILGLASAHLMSLLTKSPWDLPTAARDRAMWNNLEIQNRMLEEICHRLGET